MTREHEENRQKQEHFSHWNTIFEKSFIMQLTRNFGGDLLQVYV